MIMISILSRKILQLALICSCFSNGLIQLPPLDPYWDFVFPADEIPQDVKYVDIPEGQSVEAEAWRKAVVVSVTKYHTQDVDNTDPIETSLGLYWFDTATQELLWKDEDLFFSQNQNSAPSCQSRWMTILPSCHPNHLFDNDNNETIEKSYCSSDILLTPSPSEPSSCGVLMVRPQISSPVANSTTTIVWQQSVLTTTATQPVLFQDLIILNAQSMGICALNRNTGEIVWQLTPEEISMSITSSIVPLHADGLVLARSDRNDEGTIGVVSQYDATIITIDARSGTVLSRSSDPQEGSSLGQRHGSLGLSSSNSYLYRVRYDSFPPSFRQYTVDDLQELESFRVDLDPRDTVTLFGASPVSGEGLRNSAKEDSLLIVPSGKALYGFQLTETEQTKDSHTTKSLIDGLSPTFLWREELPGNIQVALDLRQPSIDDAIDLRPYVYVASDPGSRGINPFAQFSRIDASTGLIEASYQSNELPLRMAGFVVSDDQQQVWLHEQRDRTTPQLNSTLYVFYPFDQPTPSPVVLETFGPSEVPSTLPSDVPSLYPTDIPHDPDGVTSRKYIASTTSFCILAASLLGLFV